MLLTLGECRLFLNSKCLESYPNIKSLVNGWSHPYMERLSVDNVMGYLLGKEKNEILEHLDEDDCEFIRLALREEWTGNDFSSRSSVKTKCLLCNRRTVRHCYTLTNKFTGVSIKCGYTCYSRFIGREPLKEETVKHQRLSHEEIQKLAKKRLLKETAQRRG